jgi:hypothetical protein
MHTFFVFIFVKFISNFDEGQYTYLGTGNTICMCRWTAETLECFQITKAVMKTFRIS